MKNINKKKMEEIIIAGALGDAFGYNVEFKKLDQIIYLYGKEGIKLEHVYKWIVSDDTQMTLFCLEQLINYLQKNNIKIESTILEKINNEEIIEHIYNGYKNWLLTQNNNQPTIYNYFSDFKNKQNELLNYKSLYKNQAPGMTCLAALGSGRCGNMLNPINHSKGCGGIMRVAPIAFLPIALEQIFELGSQQAAITHGHPEGYLSAGFCAVILKQLASGYSFEQSYNSAKDILKKYINNTDILYYLNKVEHSFKKKFETPDDMNEIIGEGWVAEETLGIALYSFYHANNFEECLYISTNHNGDSDSTASVACQFYAAQYGLPEQYRSIEFDINDALQHIFRKMNQ